MKLFSSLYDWTLRLAAHRHAPWYLGTLSFAESSFFLVPPDVMLAPMVMARPQHAMRLALLTTVTSVLGGILGYLIGAYALELLLPLIERFGYADEYHGVKVLFETWGFLAVFVAGFSPFPYKIMTITAGAVGLNFPAFVLASVIGRGGRFFLVAGVLAWGGPKIEPWLRMYMERIGWAMVVALGMVAAYVALW